MKNTLYLFLLIFSSSLLAEEDVEYKFSGFIDTYHAVRSKTPYDFMSSRNRLRTEIEASKGNSYLFASINTSYNSILTGQTKIELREAYLHYNTNNWDLKAGRQIVIWGIADGLRITDLVSPMDYTEFLARDYDDIRIPVNAVKLRYYNAIFSAEAIFIPVSSFFIIPTSPDNPWSIIPSSSTMSYQVNLGNYPSSDLSNSEFGGRLSFFLAGADFSVTALHTWNKTPILNKRYSTEENTIYIDGQYSRMDMLGMDLSFPIGSFVLRGEIAEYFNELQETSFSDTQTKRNTSNLLIGLDWYPGNEWNISAQYSHKIISNYKNNITTDKNTALATLNISKSLLVSTLKISSFSYIDITNQGIFNRTSADYSLTDQIHLLGGYDFFNANKGVFSYYNDNSEYWIKIKFNF